MFPICRSITGDGLRETLRLVGRDVPLEMVETPTGTPVLDWTVPNEWNIRGAWVEGPDGTRVIDFADSNLHVLNYSVPVDAVVSLEELRDHVFTHPDDPDLVPVSHLVLRRALGRLHEPEAARRAGAGGLPRRDRLDARAGRGHLRRDARRREHHRRGRSHDLRVSSVPCQRQPLRRRRPHRARTHARRADGPPLHISLPLVARHDRCALLARTESRRGGADQARPRSVLPRRPRAIHVQAEPARGRRDRPGGRERPRATHGSRVLDWFPYGGDERQFCSPGFDLPFGAFSRTPADQFPEYHSSADDLDFVRPESLGESFAALDRRDRRRRDQRHLPEPQPVRRATAGAARPLPRHRRRVERGDGSALGSQPL